MNNPSKLVKTLVLASSLTLAGSFVLYRAGALDTITRGDHSTSAFVDDALASTLAPDTPYANPSRDAPDDEEARRRDDSATPRTFFPGSKSGVFLSRTVPDTTKTASADTGGGRPRRNVFLGGSKSLAPLVAPPPSEDDSSGVMPRREVFMGGSKSLAPLITPPEDSSAQQIVDSTTSGKRKH